jgi:lipoprotein-anchoring transpeptidase ErfK/SrfK
MKKKIVSFIFGIALSFSLLGSMEVKAEESINTTQQVISASEQIISNVASGIFNYTKQGYAPVQITPKYSTYVDVDKSNQVVTYFENGVMKLQGPCVTGNEKLRRGTPVGTFKISQHMRNKYLVGPTWKSYVHYWMKFTSSGCGLHDASWRSKFGGNIYKTAGSHGCVNLQENIAKQLYEYTSIGTIVYVHY